MSLTAEGHAAVARLEQELGVDFETGGRIRLGDWSYADCAYSPAPESRVFVEIERGQKHPTTNVVKYWPWIEAHGERRLLLVQLFDRNTSRRELTRWLGTRLGDLFPDRFLYTSADLPLDDEALETIAVGFVRLCSG